MPGYIPPTINRELQTILNQVHSDNFSLEQAGNSLTHLNFHPDLDSLTDSAVREVIEDIGPKLEVEVDENYARQYWGEVEEILSKVLQEV